MVAIRMDEDVELTGNAKIVVFGAGGGGGNAVNNMIQAGLAGVTFVAANTDVQALAMVKAEHKLQLGRRVTEGLGAGADPAKGREAAQEDKTQIKEIVRDAHMVFVTAGMGGGTGTGSAPVIAEVARESGALTVGVVTRPFTFEGAPRSRNADQGIKELAKHVDSLIVIPNDRLMAMSKDMVMTDAFAVADSVLRDAVRSISDLIVVRGLINVDFADAKRIMKGRGKAVMGMGEGSGEGRASQAAQKAMTSALLEESGIDGAMGVLVNISGGPDLKLHEVGEAMTLINKAVDPACEIIMGCVINDELADRVKVTIIATGFDMDREVGRQLEMAMTTEIPVESAAPGGHWQQQRPQGILRPKTQQQATATTPARGVLGTQKMDGHGGGYMAAPPPLPPRGTVGVAAPGAMGAHEEQTPPDKEPEFDPSKPQTWF